ncbi:MAG: hypothetical protein HYS33_01085 [Acidobacteria bacterium]|nr:hypothetical protein [Acidobacteriota bacterium]
MRRPSLSFWTVWILWVMTVAPVTGVAQKQSSGSVPAGTEIKVRLADQLDTGEAKAGQTFSGTVSEPVVAGGKTVLTKGAKVSGRVVEAVSSGRLKRPASITLELTNVGGRAVSTQPLRIDGKSHLLRNVALIGGGAGAGAVIGGLTGGKKGAAIGAAVGAGAGTATAYITGKNEIVLPSEAEIPFVMGGAATAGGATSSASSGSKPAAQKQAAAYSGESGDAAGGGAMARAAGVAEALIFSDRDRSVIRNYFQTQSGNLPPGLAKRGGKLPPGLERQLRKNGTLPPGLQKRVQPFPVELTQQLPRIPSGYSRVILAGRALLVDRNNKILDLMVAFQ